VWPDTVIEENNVQVHISAQRKTLERMEPGQSYIVTVPGRVYRFLGPSAAIDAYAGGNGDRTIPDKPSIAVLLFDVVSNDPRASTLSDGLTEDLTAALAKVPELFAVVRHSTGTYKGKAVKVQEVAEALGVRYVLEGRIQQCGYIPS